MCMEPMFCIIKCPFILAEANSLIIRLSVRFFLLLLVCGLGFGSTSAQQLPFSLEVPLPGITQFDERIPTPEAVIGHQIGTRHTLPYQVVAYFKAVAAVSDRVVYYEHGRTYEGRELIHAVVTSPANHARLETIRQANLKVSEAPGTLDDSALDDLPAVVYQGYSIHGNEASGTEAAVLYLYYLAAGMGPAVEDALANTVILLDPMFNPDGRDRFADWANRNRGAVATTDPQDREHNEPWPGGRTNHYWFDLNRDWLPAQHPESQARLTLFHQWRPQVLTDHHEMGGNSTFFFQPGIPSRTNPNTPPLNQALTGEIATYHAAALDGIGSLYFTEESYDDFYYGKGSTYPDLNGAVGILFEQASSRSLQAETTSGVLHYAFTVRNQFVTSLSTLKAVTAMRTRLLRYQRDFYREVPAVVRANPVKAYVISLERGRTRAQELVRLLRRHRIRVHALAKAVTVGGQAFRPGEAYIIPMDQPQTRLIKSSMERVSTFQDSLFYDVSTWTLPLAFDVDTAELRSLTADMMGEESLEPLMDGGARVGGTSSYAYLIPWNRYYAPRALYKLMDAGYRPRLTHKPFSLTINGVSTTFERGTLVVPVVSRAGEAPRRNLEALLDRVVAEDFVQVYAVNSGLTSGGPDLGGNSTATLALPQIALLTGSGASSGDTGEAWHLMSERFRLPVSQLDVDRVGGADLDRYNTLILAGGFYGGLPADKIKSWVRGGGRLIALGSATGWAVREGLAELEEKAMNLDSLLQGVPYDRISDTRGAQVIGGSIFAASIDRTHPLGYGLSDTLPLFRDSNTFYHPSKVPGANVGVYTEDPILSGYSSKEQQARAPGSSAVVALRMGQGKVILIHDNPNFRAFWYGSNQLFMNAIFLGGVF